MDYEYTPAMLMRAIHLDIVPPRIANFSNDRVKELANEVVDMWDKREAILEELYLLSGER
jgi:hypothetical protein